jgi:hypothetical protein
MSAPATEMNRISQHVHSAPLEAIPFIEAMTEKEKGLHEMAIKLLGSSYFVESSHAFRKWKAAKS